MDSLYNLLKRPDDKKSSSDVSSIAESAVYELLRGGKKLTALEYGISENSISYRLKHKLSDVIMVDQSADVARSAQDKITKEGILNIWPMCIDLERDYFMGEFDLIYSVETLHLATKLDQVIKKLYSFLRPDGHLLIVDSYRNFETQDDSSFGDPNLIQDQLIQIMERNRFKEVTFTQCFTFKTAVTTEKPQELPIFIMIGKT